MADQQITESCIQALLAAAQAVRDRAYVPYSHFAVGAAVYTRDGNIFTGCNVENAAYGLTLCAERNAVFHAVAEGALQFLAIAVVTSNGVTPCGSCRQVLAEFNPQMTVIVADTAGHRRTYDLRDLLPVAFGPSELPGSVR